ncbi:hypothetical protein K3Z97_04060 [Pseudomonas aeruginosa]|nr:hypothetical protein [Pseudomonas aeruginosa]
MSPTSLEQLVRDARRNNDYSPLVELIPYAKLLGIECLRLGDDMVFRLPANKDNIGNPTLPAVLLVLLAGALLGGGLVARHYRPQLEEALGQLTASRVASGQLEALLDEQQRALAAVRASAERRAKDVEQALGEARAQAAEQYAAAVRLLQEPDIGTDCQAAGAAIDRELGL